ncbi:MAG: UvrD-helicase domain-containing protein, partial [Chloroflexota bacterium]
MDLLHGLNPAQIAAVTASPGPILVVAGPGSGKTRVLTLRIVYLIEQLGVAPWHIMAVTFTNKAAREMEQRIEKLLGGRPRGLSMGTFHATCARLLRRETEHLEQYRGDFVIFDTDDQQQVVKQALRELDIDDKKFSPGRMLNGISAAKNELITPANYQATHYVGEITRRVYERYQKLLQDNNAMDFDDLLMNTVLLFERRPDVLQKYQQLYQHLLVDEFQDTNTTQYALLRQLSATYSNLFAVGDADQSIYKWRGADFRNINRFLKDFPQAQTILLEQNYRSTQVILDAAKAVIRRNSNRIDKELFTDREGGSLLVVREAYNETEEAEMVLNAIQNLMVQGVSPGDCAVMYRTNAQSRALEEAFVRAKMPYRLVGATRFYGRREIKDLLAYLRIVQNPADSISFGRVINTPPRGIGAKTQQTLQSWAERNNWQPAEALLRLASDPELQHPLGGRAFTVLYQLGETLQGWLRLRDMVGVGDLLDTILEAIRYREYLDDGTEEGRERWENVMELRNVAALDPALHLGEFLEQVSLVSEVDNLEETPNAPTLLTLHAAKGLEFPIVFITGLEEGMLPHSRSLNDPEELAEERRLFYVGLTRAKDQVHLSHAFRRTFFGDSELNTPSRFLNDIPADLLSGGSHRQRHQQAVARASSWSWSPPASRFVGGDSSPAKDVSVETFRRNVSTDRPLPKPYQEVEEETAAAPVKARFRPGQRVRHAKFGDGIVIDSKITGDDE